MNEFYLTIMFKQQMLNSNFEILSGIHSTAYIISLSSLSSLSLCFKVNLNIAVAKEVQGSVSQPVLPNL
jgi:hypothetical protein